MTMNHRLRRLLEARYGVDGWMPYGDQARIAEELGCTASQTSQCVSELGISVRHRPYRGRGPQDDEMVA